MFCQKCGKEIEDNAKFCPHCGNKSISSNIGSITDTVKKATDTAVNLAQSAKNAANEATNGQAEKYAEKVKETAQGFTDDVKQVAKDKDTSSFFKKNNYKNLKILAVLVVAICLLLGAISDIDNNKKTAILAVEARIYKSYPSAEISNAKVIEKDDYGRYLVSMDIEVFNERGYAIGVAIFSSDDISTSIYPYRDKSEKKSAIKEQKRISNWGEKISK